MFMVFGALLEFTFVNWLANKKVIATDHRTSWFKLHRVVGGRARLLYKDGWTEYLGELRLILDKPQVVESDY